MAAFGDVNSLLVFSDFFDIFVNWGKHNSQWEILQSNGKFEESWVNFLGL